MDAPVHGDQLFVKIINYYKFRFNNFKYNKIFTIIIIMPYTQNVGFPSLTPTYGLGSRGRTGSAVLISSPRNKIGNQGRIYYWMKSHGQGYQYIQFLIKVLGNPRD